MKKFLFFILIFLSQHSNAKQTILIIGDSHLSGHFGQRLDDLFKNDPNHQVATYGVAGAVAEYFYRGTEAHWGYYYSDLNGKTESGNDTQAPLIENLIAHIRPDIIIVELGFNYLNYDQTWAKKNIQKLEKLCSENTKLWWLGPPNASTAQTKNVEKIYQLLNSSLNPTTSFIDSRNYSQYPVPGAKDGIHYWGADGKKAANEWAQNIYEIIKSRPQY